MNEDEKILFNNQYLEQMKIEEIINFKEIYDNLQKKMNETKELWIKYGNSFILFEKKRIKVEIIGFQKTTFSIKVLNLILKKFKFPSFKIKFKIDEEIKEYDIICFRQIIFLIKDIFKFQNPHFYCENCQKCYSYKKDLYYNHKYFNFYIFDLEINYLDENCFKKFFVNEVKGFIGKKYKIQ